MNAHDSRCTPFGGCGTACRSQSGQHVDPPQLSVVIPCYNEAAVIRQTYARVKAVCIGVALSHEIVLVNDGSTDATWEVISELAAADPAVVAVGLSRNHGHQLAL